MPKPLWLQDDEFAATSLAVLAVQSSRTPSDLDYRDDLFDATCMRAAALAFSNSPAEREEHLRCCKHARSLASSPQQQAVANSFQAAAMMRPNQLISDKSDKYAELDLPDDMRETLNLLEKSAGRSQ